MGDAQDRDALGKMRAFGDAIGRLAEQGELAYLTNPEIRDLIHYNLIMYGEMVRRLSDKCQKEHADIPWQQIYGIRNRLVHEHEKVDSRIIWRAVSQELPEVQAQLNRLTTQKLDRVA